MSKNKGGRPSKYQPDFCRQAEKLTALGATDREVAEFFKVSEATLNTWKHQHQEFLASLKLGKDAADRRVEQSLYRKALGYTQDDINFSNYQGTVTQTPYVKHVPPDTTACIFWLKNRKPQEWRDRVEHSGADGGPVEVQFNDREFARRVAFALAKGMRQKEAP